MRWSDIRRSLGTTLVAAAFASPLCGGSVSGEIGVSAHVVARTIVTTGAWPATITVTDVDVRRGYLDLPHALAFMIRSNAREGYLVRFDLSSERFARAHVRWRRVHVVVGGGQEVWVAQPYLKESLDVQADVRLELSRDTEPGTYRFPLQINVSSL